MDEKPKKLTLVVMSKTTIIVLIVALVLGIIGLEWYLRNAKRAQFEERTVNELNVIRDDILDLRFQSSVLQRKSNTCSFSLALQPRVDSLEIALTDLARTVINSSDRLDVLYKQVNDLFNSLDDRIENVNQKVSDIGTEVKSTREDLEKCEKYIISLVKAIEDVNKLTLENQRQTNILKSQVVNLTTQVSDLKGQVSDLKGQLVELQQRFDKEILRLDTENHLMHYNYDVVLKTQKRAAGLKTE